MPSLAQEVSHVRGNPYRRCDEVWDETVSAGRRVLILAAAVTHTGLLAPPGHAAPAQKEEDVLPALLAEVKGLRAAMEQMASPAPGPAVRRTVAAAGSADQLDGAASRHRARRPPHPRKRIDRTRQQLKQVESGASSNPAELPSRRKSSSAAGAEAAGRRREGGRGPLCRGRSAARVRSHHGAGTLGEINQRLDELGAR
jgi:hypothetical protein